MVFPCAAEQPVPPKEKSSAVPVLSLRDIPSVDVQSPFQEPVYPGSSAAGFLQSGAATKSVTNWETLVLFAVNLSRLDVVVNMSNVMGNTTSVFASAFAS